MPTSADETLTEKAMLDCLTKVVRYIQTGSKLLYCQSSLTRRNLQQLYGFCFVHGVPATPEDTEELIKRIAPIRHTHCQSNSR